MNKPILVLEGPIATRSGYGEATRTIARNIIGLNKFDIKIVSTPWGACPQNALSEETDMDIIQHLIGPPFHLPRQPEVFIQVTIPNEFRPVGKFNIGYTAGIETSICSQQWIEGCNRMDLVLGMSNHAVNIIKSTIVHQHDQSGAIINDIKLTKQMDVLHCAVDTNVFKKTDKLPETIQDAMFKVKEKFCYLFVGHWIKGDIGEDRKNIGMLIKLFCETFKNTVSAKRPALILKTSGASFSILDREEILNKIKIIRGTVGNNCPNVYLVHGDLTPEEMNGLYNHPKVKVHISLTKGEGFGLPLLEASLSEKPIIASGWSGHLDFLNPTDALLLAGELRLIEPGAVWDNILIKESSWFNADPEFACKAMMHAFTKYDVLLPGAHKLARENAEKFNHSAIQKKTDELLSKYVPDFHLPQEIPLVLPTLKKI